MEFRQDNGRCVLEIDPAKAHRVLGTLVRSWMVVEDEDIDAALEAWGIDQKTFFSNPERRFMGVTWVECGGCGQRFEADEDGMIMNGYEVRRGHYDARTDWWDEKSGGLWYCQDCAPRAFGG